LPVTVDGEVQAVPACVEAETVLCKRDSDKEGEGGAETKPKKRGAAYIALGKNAVDGR